jgi:transcriptional regulator with XRE-family HTH domain
MGTNPTKAMDNIYCRCRKDAAKYNDKLNSREGASELLGVSPSSLADYELGNTKVVPVDKVVLMADLYNAPEIKNYYCTHECPIGQETIHKLEVAEFDRLTLKVLAALRKMDSINDALVEIAADGKVNDWERPKFNEVMASLDDMAKHTQELRLWAEKNLK